MRNPHRTTKPERAAARRRLPAACRRWGIAYTARASRTLTDAAIRLALAIDMPPHIITSAEPGANHWTATVEPPPFVCESWPDAGRIRISGFGGTATFTQDELALTIEPDPRGAFGVYTDRGTVDLAPVGAPPFDTDLYGRYRAMFEAGGYVEPKPSNEYIFIEPNESTVPLGTPSLAPHLHDQYRRMFEEGEYEFTGLEGVSGDEPLGPSECGHYDVVDIRPNVDMICVPFADNQVPEEWNSLLKNAESQDDPLLKPCDPIPCEETARPEDDR